MQSKSNDGLALNTLISAVSAIAIMSATATSSIADDKVDRLDQLERQIDSLQKELEGVRGQVEREAPGVARNERILGPREMKSGSDDVSLTVSGQVNRGVLITDDGDDADVFFVDNDNSSTRIRLLGDAKFNDDVSIGSIIEVQFESNSTADVSQDNQRNAGNNNFTERKLEVFADSKAFGRLWLGQGDTASNGSSEVDLSGTGVVGYSGIADLAGGIQFVDGDGNLSGVTIGDAFSNFDGLSRDDRIRYDTPRFSGAKLSASAIADDRWDVALRYSRELFGANEFEAAIAYADVDDEFDQISGSASVKLGSIVPGLNFTLAAGAQDPDDGAEDTGAFIYSKIGYLTKFKGKIGGLGKTGVAIDYYYGDDVDLNGDEADSIGVLAVQNVDRIGTELYAGYRFHSLDRNGEDFDDINALLVGARVKF
ncbi:MAG: hypothetical protein ACRBM6_24125 [Geminicoccales bacterium]